MNETRIKRIIENNYEKPGHPISFTSPRLIYQYFDGQLPLQKIIDVLSSFDSYTLHKEARRHKHNPSYSHFKRYQMQCDVIDVQELQKANDGRKYILACIDTFTRKAFVRAMTNKRAATVTKYFDDILKEAVIHPTTLVVDRGSEFTNTTFLNYCKSKNIKVVHNFTGIHAAYIERFNRTFQSLLYRYLTSRESHHYLSALQALVTGYNSRVHRIIKMTPNEAEVGQNQKQLSRTSMERFGKYKMVKHVKLFKGQLVRIRKDKTKFARGYHRQNQEEVFRIAHIYTHLPIPLFKLESENAQEQIRGNFYAADLVPVKNVKYKIESILKKRGKGKQVEYLVKFWGYKDPSWVKKNDVTSFQK